MAKSIEKTGKTIEEAVELALKELDASKENVEIEVLEEPAKGLLGIGAKPALVKVTLKDNRNEIINEFWMNTIEFDYAEFKLNRVE